MTHRAGPFRSHRAWAFLLFAFALAVYAVFGFDGAVGRDYGLYLYSAQETLRGLLPYVGAFDHKGPLGPLVAALGMGLGRLVGADDVYAARFLYACLCALVPAWLYLITVRLAGSRGLGLVAALTFLSFAGFAVPAASGIEPKSLLVVALVGSLCLALQGRWGWAAFAGSLCGLIWQTALVLPVLLFALLLLQRAPRKALGAVVLGAAVPVGSMVLVYALAGGLAAFWDGFVGFNLAYIARPYRPLLDTIPAMAEAVYQNYRFSFFPLVLGSMGLGVWGLRVLRPGTSAGERYLLGSFLFFLAFSLYDFGGPRDLFPLLPYLAVGGAVLLGRLPAFGPSAQGGRRGVVLVACGALLLATGFEAALPRSQRYPEQKARFHALVAAYGADVSVAAFGTPQFLAVTGLQNASRYTFISGGIDRYIAAHTPGGFAGWLRAVTATRPAVIAVGADAVFRPPDAPLLQGAWATQADVLQGVLTQAYRRQPEFSTWDIAVFVRADLAEPRPSEAPPE